MVFDAPAASRRNDDGEEEDGDRQGEKHTLQSGKGGG